MKKVELYSDFSQKKNLQPTGKSTLSVEEKLLRALDLIDLHIAIRASNPIPKPPDQIKWIELKKLNE